MATPSKLRETRGKPEGGQFAEKRSPEAEVSLRPQTNAKPSREEVEKAELRRRGEENLRKIPDDPEWWTRDNER